jgi:hypothetical protein
MTEEETRTPRQRFADHLESHDWWYGMSDDHRYWSAGSASFAGLSETHRRLAPPWTLAELRSWALGMVSDLFGPEERGQCTRIDGTGRRYSPASELISRDTADQISRWMEG